VFNLREVGGVNGAVRTITITDHGRTDRRTDGATAVAERTVALMRCSVSECVFHASFLNVSRNVVSLRVPCGRCKRGYVTVSRHSRDNKSLLIDPTQPDPPVDGFNPTRPMAAIRSIDLLAYYLVFTFASVTIFLYKFRQCSLKIKQLIHKFVMYA